MLEVVHDVDAVAAVGVLARFEDPYVVGLTALALAEGRHALEVLSETVELRVVGALCDEEGQGKDGKDVFLEEGIVVLQVEEEELFGVELQTTREVVVHLVGLGTGAVRVQRGRVDLGALLWEVGVSESVGAGEVVLGVRDRVILPPHLPIVPRHNLLHIGHLLISQQHILPLLRIELHLILFSPLPTVHTLARWQVLRHPLLPPFTPHEIAALHFIRPNRPPRTTFQEVFDEHAVVAATYVGFVLALGRRVDEGFVGEGDGDLELAEERHCGKLFDLGVALGQLPAPGVVGHELPLVQGLSLE